MNNKIWARSSLVLGIVFIGLAGMYWAIPAGSLPSYMPGFIADSSVIHFKHGLASLILALGLFAFAWFTSGKKSAY